MRAAALLTVLGALLVAAAPAGAADWQAWPMPVPPGGRYETPVGLPGDLAFWAPNRGLMTVGGNNSVPEGIYSWDGSQWHQLAVVCGSAATARIAWAGPDEFWTIARPSLPRPQTAGTALCHFKDGAVVGSYSTPDGADDPYHTMLAAACNGPSDCWFGGVFGQDGAGRRSGAFHLHWDGTSLTSVYGPQGRAVSDLLVHGGTWWESTYVGPQPDGANGDATLRDPETVPALIHHINGDATFTDDPFVPLARDGVPTDGTELRALDGDATTAWAVGGGANPGGQPVARPPLVARLDGDGWHELQLTGDPLPSSQVLTDVAAVPGTGSAWATLSDTNGGTGEAAQPEVVHIGADGAVTLEQLAGDADPSRGAARRVACPAANDCWLATARGYLYRLTGAPSWTRDDDPAFQGTISQRPNEAAEQAIPDDPPQDDSGLVAPPVELQSSATPVTGSGTCPAVKALITHVKVKVRGVRRLAIVLRFRLARTARVGLTAKRHGRLVGRVKARTLTHGTHALVLPVSRRRWPTKLTFVVRETRAAKSCTPSSDSNTVVTPG